VQRNEVITGEKIEITGNYHDFAGLQEFLQMAIYQ
jgi:hypothetical protein